MQNLTNYEKRVIRLMETIMRNIEIDFEGDFSKEDLQDIKALYLQVYQQESQIQRQIIYQQLKSKITSQNQLAILNWFEKSRGRKYSGETLPQNVSIQKYHSTTFCISADYLDSSRFVGLTHCVPVTQKASLQPISFSLSQMMLGTQPKTKKRFLYKKVKQRQNLPTNWVVQTTKDRRYIWRAKDSIDKKDLQYLLQFLLTKRSQNDVCPSIVINAGSHGDMLGHTASDVGSFQYTDKMIYEQTIDTLAHMIQNEDPRLKVNKTNITSKIFVYFLSSSTPNIYPPKADHIIDTQCYGAFVGIKSERLYLSGSFIAEDLKFLSNNIPTKPKPQPTQKQNIKPIQTQIAPKTKTKIVKDASLDLNLVKNKYFSQPIKKLIKESAIIKKELDAQKLVSFFQFNYKKKSFFSTYTQHFVLKDLKLLFRASQHHFNTDQYLKLYGDIKNTFFICLTEKDKIIGAYSPLTHLYKSSIMKIFQEQGDWVNDRQKDSFVFSVTNDELFRLKIPEKAIYRTKDHNCIIFGFKDFSICDNANKVKESVTNLNSAYIHAHYVITDLGKFSPNNCLRFNGNETPKFLIKQWQAWKIQLCEVNQIVD